jgi:hypothetical protein
VRTSRGASAREVGSEDGNVTHWSKACGGVVKVRRVEAVVRRGRVLRRERRWATGGAVRTVRGPASLLSLLDVGEMALAAAPPAIVQGEDRCEEDEDWRAKRTVANGGSGRVKRGNGDNGGDTYRVQGLSWHVPRRSVRHNIRRYPYSDGRKRERSTLSGKRPRRICDGEDGIDGTYEFTQQFALTPGRKPAITTAATIRAEAVLSIKVRPTGSEERSVRT